MYRDGQHEEALAFYTQALSMAKTNPQKIALHSNRAACYLKLHRFNKAAEECTLVLELDQNHTGALMLRAQTLVTLKEYTSALFDVNRLMELNPSSDVYQNLQTRLKTQLSLAPIPECEEESLTVAEDEEEEDNEPAIALADKKTEATRTIPYPEAPASQTQSFGDLRSVYVKEWESAPKPNVHAEPVIRHANQKTEATRTILKTEALASRTHNFKDLPDAHSKEWETIPKPKEHSKPMIALADKKAQATGPSHNPEAPSSQTQSSKDVAPVNSRAWEAIPKPKGHSNLDYSRWNKVEDDSSEDEEDEDEESLPRYRFRVRTVGVRPVK